MAAKVCADIKPTGVNQRDLVDLFYDIISSIQGVCAKLDADGGVPLTTYTANCVTAIFNVKIEDSKGNYLDLAQADSSGLLPTVIVTPTGIGSKEAVFMMYQITNAMETLTEQLDTDALTLSTYEANAFTAYFLHIVEDGLGNALGNGSDYYFRPTGVLNLHKLIDWLYNTVESIYTMCAQLDSDGTVTDTDYTALWYTANILITTENSGGSKNGN